jgi:hypothetical protein
MMSPSDFPRPPRVAIWLVNLFIPFAQDESIQGDLLEEFSHIASTSGIAAARRWYWRQSVKTGASLFGSGFRASPWSTTAAVVGGFFLLRFVSGLPDKLLSQLTDRYLFYWSAHFKTYMFLATDGMLIAHFFAAWFVGCIVALAAKGREIVTTLSLVFVLGALAVVGSVAILARTGDLSLVPMLLLPFLDSLAIVIGGVMIRTRRSTANRSRLSAA